MEGVCANEFCQTMLNEQRTKLEALKIENEVLKVSLNDCSACNESVIHELRRLLEKETAAVNMLNAKMIPDGAGLFTSCTNCMYHKEQARLAREANAQEYRWVLHFAKMSKNLRLELQDALTKEKTKHAQLRNAYDELHVRKTDPLCRDAEVARLRAELQEAKQHHLNANQTALMANRVTEALRKELENAHARVAELDMEGGNMVVRIRALEEIVDTCRRSDELKNCSVGQCRDYVCLRRVMDCYDKEKEYRAQIDALQREQAYHLNTIMQLRRDSEDWRRLTSHPPEEVLSNHVVVADPPRAAKAAPKALLVADLANFNELRMNIASLFTIWSIWTDEALDGDQMLADFVLDIHPAERRQNLMALLLCCHGNQVPTGVGESDLHPSNRLVRSCFFACIRASGGVSRKVGARTVWTNVRRNRSPIYSNS
jgi:hypothetical protein